MFLTSFAPLWVKTQVCGFIPRCVVSHPGVWFHTQVCGFIPRYVLPYPGIWFHTHVCGFIPMYVVSYPGMYVVSYPGTYVVSYKGMWYIGGFIPRNIFSYPAHKWKQNSLISGYENAYLCTYPDTCGILIGVCKWEIDLFSYGDDGSVWFASELKALQAHCGHFEAFPPGKKVPRRHISHQA
jgi:hypothetical protein